MAVWQNFVQTTLNADVLAGHNALLFNDAPAPWQNPPDPGGEIAYCTITDDVANPTSFEIISYTSIAGFGPFTMSGITRGVEGTTPREWSAGAYIVQYLTSAQAVDTEELSSTVGDVVINGGEF